MLQPGPLDELCELPVSFFEDRRGHYRHAQVCAASYGELKAALEQAYADGWGSFVVVSHSFEFIRSRWDSKTPSTRHLVLRRFEALCRFLAGNRDRFETATFQGLESTDVIVAEPSSNLTGKPHRTLSRLIQQAVGRVW